MSVPIEYLQFRDAILSSDEYYGFADDLRSACRRFVSLDGEVDKTAYEAAFKEVLDLMAAKKLTPSPAHPFPDIHGSQVPRETDAASPPVEADIPGHIGFDTHGLLRVRVADLKPNPVNATVFSSSLGDESIRELAEDITRRKLRNPIEVRPDLELVDGERRHRGLLLLGAEETYVRVVNGLDTQEEVEGYVWDAFSSARKPDLIEMVNVYELGVKVLAHRHGRPRGRPSKKDRRDDDLFWTVEQVKTAAAKRAHFASEVIADRATSVVRRADADLLAKLVAGEVTISAAYATLSKPKSEKKKAKGSEDKGSTGAKPKKADTEETETKATDSSTTAHADDDQGEQAQADHKAKDKPTTQGDDGDAGSSTGTATSTSSSTSTASAGEKSATRSQDEQTSSTTSEAAASSTSAQEKDASSSAEASRPSAHEQTKGTNAEANSTTDPQEKPPQATPRQALDTLRGYVRQKGKGAARAITREINDEAGLPWWVQTSKPRDDLSTLDDHVADRLEALADKDLEDATAWLTEHVEQLWGIIRERVPRQEGDDRTDNSDYE